MKCQRTKKEIRVSQGKAVCFATEVVRACLCQPTTNVRLCGLWAQMDMVIKNPIERGLMFERMIVFRILIASGNYVRVNCAVSCMSGGGEWKSANVEVVLLDKTGRRINADSPHWNFRCFLDDEGRVAISTTQTFIE